MPDALKKVLPGEALRIPAAAFNAFIDAAVDFQNRQRDQDAGCSPVRPDLCTVLLENNSGSDLDRFGVLGIDVPLFVPTDDSGEHTDRVALSGVTPGDPTHVGRFAIALEPIAAGKVGRAAVAGVCSVQVNVQIAGDRFADIYAGDSTCLKSGSSGAAAILWVASGTGVKWAIIRFGGGGGSGLPSNAGCGAWYCLQVNADNTGNPNNPALNTFDHGRAEA